MKAAKMFIITLIMMGAVSCGNMPLLFTTIDQGLHSGIEFETLMVIKHDGVWRYFWEDHKSHISPPPACPVIDFANEMVIAVIIGNRENGCYSAGIDNIEKTPLNRIIVRYTENKPDQGCLCPAVMTQPNHIVKVKRRDLRITFKGTVNVFECD